MAGRRSLAAMPLRSGLFLPVFDELADPALIARLAAEAEQAHLEAMSLPRAAGLTW